MTFDSTADASTTSLLSGPRGRQVCAEAARLVEPDLLPPREATDEKDRRLLIEQLTNLAAPTAGVLEDPFVRPVRRSRWTYTDRTPG